MSDSWLRSHWKPSDRTAKLFYVVLGVPQEGGLQVSRARHRVTQHEPEIEITTHQRSGNEDWFNGWFDFPGGRFSEVFGEKAPLVRSTEHLTVVQADFTDRDNLDYLRNTIGMVSAIVDNFALGVFDMYRASWMTAEEWTRKFIDRDAFRVKDHIAIAVTEDDRFQPGLWLHTRGMIKFARPELQVRHVPQQDAAVQTAAEVLERIAGYLAAGAAIRHGEQMTIRNPEGKLTFLETPDDSESDEPHFCNASLEICQIDENTGQAQHGIARLL